MKKNTFKKLTLLTLLFICLSGFSLVSATTHDDDTAVIQKASKIFTKVAKNAIDTVVFIKVEQTIETAATPFQYNNPFDLFEDESFRRFFGQRFPQMKPSQKQKQTGWGSGFIISDEGHILTNHHVVGNADKIEVRLKDGREFKASIIGTDEKSDVALIKIEKGKNLPVIALGDSESLDIGEWVMAIGNPFGLSHTLTVGVVSAKGRNSVGVTDYEDFIQTDAAINPGNSGGPLINLKGEVVGINTAIFSKSGGYMGIGFAIPINMVKAIKSQLIEKGRVERGYLGVGIQDLSKDLVSSFGLKNNEGVLISQVSKDSPAEKFNLQRGDVVIRMEENKVTDVGQFRNMVALTKPGTSVELTVLRKGKEKKIKVKLGNISQAEAYANQNDQIEKLGIALQDLSDDLARQFGYQKEEGVLISNVQNGSPAAFAGLRPGMLILEINRVTVKKVSDITSLLEKSREGSHILILVKDRQGSRYISFPTK